MGPARKSAAARSTFTVPSLATAQAPENDSSTNTAASSRSSKFFTHHATGLLSRCAWLILRRTRSRALNSRAKA
jgi:hypothetical protein